MVVLEVDVSDNDNIFTVHFCFLCNIKMLGGRDSHWTIVFPLVRLDQFFFSMQNILVSADRSS